MSEPRDVRELVGDEVQGEELERLRRMHELLVAAGPPPELSPTLARPPLARPRRLGFLPRRRLEAALVLAAAVAAAAFGGGYLLGQQGDGFRTIRAVPMHGTAWASLARASVRIGEKDESGNWPLLVTVRGLKPLPRGGSYQLYLTKNGRPAAFCGYFAVHSGTTTVRLTVPWELKRFDGWVVTERLPGHRESRTPVLTT